MIELDPKKVLANPWLWDEKTIEWARSLIDDRQQSSETPEAHK